MNMNDVHCEQAQALHLLVALLLVPLALLLLQLLLLKPVMKLLMVLVYLQLLRRYSSNSRQHRRAMLVVRTLLNTV
jgi:hypothetical protein